MTPNRRSKAGDPQQSQPDPVDAPILITGAAGGVGGVGAAIVEKLRQQNLPVRALVHREDERAEALRATGAEVVVGDLTRAGDMVRALAGCRRLYFGMSVSASLPGGDGHCRGCGAPSMAIWRCSSTSPR